MPRVNVWLVHNPAAGAYDIGRYVTQVAERLSEQGATARSVTTERRGELALVAQRAAAEGVDALFVAGGDGSLGEVATALAGTRVALGVLPAGTANVWARQFGLPVAPLLEGEETTRILVDAARAQLDGDRRLIDLGDAGGRCFLMWAGVGLDAYVTHGVEPRPREQKRLGMVSYALAALMLATQFKGMTAHVTVDGRRVRGRMLLAVVSHSRLYMGGLVHIDPRARLDDGRLTVWVFYGLGFGWTVRQMLGMAAGRHLRDPHVRQLRGRAIAITTREPAEVHLDGDPWGKTPLAVRVRPLALRILAPRSAPPELFSRAALTGGD
jgi:diacylglycerol kinase (ATP)